VFCVVTVTPEKKVSKSTGIRPIVIVEDDTMMIIIVMLNIITASFPGVSVFEIY
jgi:hypothetical protein